MIKFNYFSCADATAKPAAKAGENVPVYIDRDRMDRALKSPRTEIPPGLSAEEIRRLILGVAALHK